MVTEKIPEIREENCTNGESGVVLSDMPNPDEIWPHRCGADYVANLAPPIDWNAAAARCRARCERDMVVSASRIGADGSEGFGVGSCTGDGGNVSVRSNTRRSFFRQVFPGIAMVNGFSIWEAAYDLQWGWACAFSVFLAVALVVNESAKRFERLTVRDDKGAVRANMEGRFG